VAGCEGARSEASLNGSVLNRFSVRCKAAPGKVFAHFSTMVGNSPAAPTYG